MKSFTVKYEDTSGGCHVETVSGHSQQDALWKLRHPCKEIYWVNFNSIIITNKDKEV